MNFDASDYSSNLRKKIEDAQSTFLSRGYISTSVIERSIVLPSPTKYFRQRCRFAVRRIDNSDSMNDHCGSPDDVGGIAASKLQYFMWEGGYPIVEVDDFPIASIQIVNMMPVLLAFIAPNGILSNGLAAIHFLSSSIGHIVCTLIYDQKIVEIDWIPAATQLREQLMVAEIAQISVEHISIVGRSKGAYYLLLYTSKISSVNI